MLCAKDKFFPWCGFRDTEVQIFPVFLTWLTHHMTDDIIIFIATFHISSRTNGENFVSIRQVLVEKNTKVLRIQTNKQTDKQTEKLLTEPSKRDAEMNFGI